MLGCCLAIEKLPCTALGVRKHSLRQGQPEFGLGILEAARKLGHLDLAGAEGDEAGKRALRLVKLGEFWLELGLAWENRKAFYGR